MDVLVAVDPGIDRCGVATFLDARLTWAGYVGVVQKASVSPFVRARDTARAVHDAVVHVGIDKISMVAIEWPRMYTPGKSKGGGRDLMLLVAVGSAFAALLSAETIVDAIEPDRWKGQLPETVLTGRVIARLSSEERAVLTTCLETVPEGKRHNVFDACGIALWVLKRL